MLVKGAIGHIDFKRRFTYKACNWKSFHHTRLGDAMTSKLRMFCFKALNDMYFPEVPWAINGLENVLINPVLFFHGVSRNCSECRDTNIVLSRGTSNTQVFFSVTVLSVSVSWLANCHMDSSKLWVMPVKWHSFSILTNHAAIPSKY